MKEYIIIFERLDQGLIDTTCLHPDPVEAFAFMPVGNEKMKVSTYEKKRFDTWVKTLRMANKKFEIIPS